MIPNYNDGCQLIILLERVTSRQRPCIVNKRVVFPLNRGSASQAQQFPRHFAGSHGNACPTEAAGLPIESVMGKYVFQMDDRE